MSRQTAYDELFQALDTVCTGETNHVTIMATVACELYHQFDHIDWAGFYRNTGEQVLKVSPCQGGHGCITIPFSRGICGGRNSVAY